MAAEWFRSGGTRERAVQRHPSRAFWSFAAVRHPRPLATRRLHQHCRTASRGRKAYSHRHLQIASIDPPMEKLQASKKESKVPDKIQTMGFSTPPSIIHAAKFAFHVKHQAKLLVALSWDSNRMGRISPKLVHFELNDGNIENVWNHGTRLNGQGFKCGYCGMTNKGGGATRLRDHLGGIVGEVRSCDSVPRVVWDATRELRKLSMEKKREKEQRKGVHGGDEVIDLASDEEDQARMDIRNSLRNKNISRAIERRSVSGKAVRVLLAKGVSTAYFDKDLARSKASVQPKIDTAILEGSREKLGQAWAKWFHANDIAG
ncbi:hypothetical protein C2845_PM04G08610 [Panicum miliaceum]|uniref:BED-type domain-containing protein n=1 Tax=Panicum miliaceum TaxID=4540 RepID=A0A3L6QLD8_PANMI|nr:hypothetical protein C2845_PM04G08610 [Panicum miliaceum]